MKKKIQNQKKHGIKRMCAALAGAFLIAESSNPCIYANAAGSTGCEIYHQHTGEESTGGGCYQEIVYHAHSGNETEGGTCYETPVYHVHQGDAKNGGGCYGNAIYHQHSGNTASGGDCYSAVTHSHTDSCNVSKECKVTHTAVSVNRTWEAYCYHHQETTQGEATVIADHSSCGKGKVETTINYCLKCGPYSNTHTYSVVGCGISTSTITGYKLSCEKDESTPEGYETNCGKSDTDVDAYTLSCEKTEASVEGYRLSCKMEEGVPVARLELTNETAGMQQSVTLSASVTDLTGGNSAVGSGSYCWYDGSGNVIGRQATVTVSQNGSYRVEYTPEGGSAGFSGLSHSIQVDNVLIPTPVPVQTPAPAQSGDNTGGAGSGEMAAESGTNAQQGNTSSSTAKDGKTASASPSPSASPVATSTPAKAVIPSHSPAVLSNGMKEGVSAVIGRLWEDKEDEDVGKQTPTPVPAPSVLPTELASVEEETEGNGAAEQQPEVLGEERKEDGAWVHEFKMFMKKPAVKIFTLTTGTLIGAGLLGIMLFFLRRTVKVYNDDGNGNMIYLGRCIITEEGDNFSIIITGEMEEKAYTNRYCIKPGLFRLGRGEDRELIVCKEQKRISVYLEKEMIVVI